MSDQNGKVQRRLSFVEDESIGALSNEYKRSSYIAPPPTLSGSEALRRQSQWNMPGGRRRNSIVNRRLSNSFESRKSSSQDTGFNRVRYQNTYRTCPENSEIFQPFRFEPRIYDILERTLHGKKYDPHKVAVLTKELTQEISREARCTLTLSPRYKLITHVALIENKGQDVRLGSRCLWDTNYDNMASATYKNSSIYAVGTVYAVYFE